MSDQQQAIHEKYMRRALDLARQAAGHTSPNPAVGAVIVKNDQVVAEGFTQPVGKPHAEAEALRKAGEHAKGATIYVTLEPCNHFGRTPPCTLGIIEAGIKEVHYSVVDPNPRAAGGHQRLLDAGLTVHTGMFEEEAHQLNRYFFHHTRTGLPYVTAKFACSLDGKIATHTGESQWITGPAARQKGHELRQLSDGILIGGGTALADDPRLTTRLTEGDSREPSHPTRVILDTNGKLPETLNLLTGELPGKTIVAVSDQISNNDRERLIRPGVELIETKLNNSGRIDIHHLLEQLGQQDMQSLMVEGGSQVLGSFFEKRAVDEVWAFIAPKIIGGQAAPGPIGGMGFANLQDAFELEEFEIEKLGPDLFVRGQVRSKK
ncbi:MAG: bifunctional diaminohydroxyphosphoribosylaminopyrimidine deaminase/5-amino-6-(5-phosphoribosylamino)uracil reductase RibD [Chloroflexota bacterium]